MRSQSSCRLGLFFMGLTLLLGACSKESAGQSESYPDANPTSFTLRNAKFLKDIGATDGADALGYAADIQAGEKAAPLVIQCDEFESTSECDRRRAEINLPQKPYGPGYTAFVMDAAFKYDADRGTMEIGAFGRDLLNPYLSEIGWHLTVKPVGSQPPPALVAQVDRQRAKRWREESQTLRIVVVISLEGLARPVLSGDRIAREELNKVAANLITPRSDDQSQRGIESLRMKRFEIRARVIRVFAFNPEDGGVSAPIYDWVSPDKQFVR